MNQPPLIDVITASISNFGFPIVLAGYLLLRFEKRLEMLNTTIQEWLYQVREEVQRKK